MRRAGSAIAVGCRQLGWLLNEVRFRQPRLFSMVLVLFTGLVALAFVATLNIGSDSVSGEVESPGSEGVSVAQGGSERPVRYVPYNGLANSEEGQEPPASDAADAPSEPEVVLRPWSEVMHEPLDEAELIYGTDGSEGSILPLDNGVVPSSGPRFVTSWELILPSAKIRAAVVQVGLTPFGAMGSPDNPFVVGWFNQSAVPGELGNALLGGHRDYEDRDNNIGVGVCWELDRTRVGDQLIMHDQSAHRYYVYDIVEIATIRPNSDDAVRYLTQTRESVVTLITCTGDFDDESNSYEERIFVVALLSAVAAPDA